MQISSGFHRAPSQFDLPPVLKMYTEGQSLKPPFFRQNHGVDHGEKPTKNLLESEPEPGSNPLPVIDCLNLNPEKLSEVCKEWGMFSLVNHGVELKLLNQILELANEIFSLSFESKQALFTNPILYFWGSPALSLSRNAQQTGPDCPQNFNWLEGFNIPLNKISRFQYEDPLLETFRALLEGYGSHQSRLATTIFKTMAEDLDFSPTKSNSYLSLPTGFLRVYRYLRCPEAEQRWGIHEHTDSSVLSILHQDQVGGLQVSKDSKWLDVKPMDDTLIVNLGDMMQAMSDDRYVSVKHRVKVNKQKERISIGYFVFPAEDAVIESSKYKPFTYADFQAEKELDLKTLGTKVGLPRFKISEKNLKI